MYSFTRFFFRAFIFSCSLALLNATAAPVDDHDDLSQTGIQSSINVLKGESSPVAAGQALDVLKSFESSENLNLRNQALVWLGRAYRDGLAGTGKDVKRAFHYFEQAAGKDGGDPVARYELAQGYYQGSGTDRNLIAAYMWVSLSLHQETDVSDSAKMLQEKLATLLNKDQLSTAEILISQMEKLYLKK